MHRSNAKTIAKNPNVLPSPSLIESIIPDLLVKFQS